MSHFAELEGSGSTTVWKIVDRGGWLDVKEATVVNITTLVTARGVLVAVVVDVAPFINESVSNIGEATAEISDELAPLAGVSMLAMLGTSIVSTPVGNSPSTRFVLLAMPFTTW